MTKTALIIGATGGAGSEIARALLKRGYRVRALHRDPERASARQLGAIEWLKGDAMNAEDVLRAASGVNLVVHAANPLGYRNWQGLALPMLENSIAAARSAGARLVLPGTVYNYGPETFPFVAESAPQQPRTRKGAIRVAMEQRLAQASREGVPVLIVRAGDFFGAPGQNSWFNQALVTPGKALRWSLYPGKRDVGHAWAYLPDLAETIAQLLDREAELGVFETFHFGGHWFERGVDIAEATRRAAGAPHARIWNFPWFAVYLLSPFVETFREMIEMRYLWRSALRLDNSKLVAFLGKEPHTPLDQALRTTLRELGVHQQPEAGGLGRLASS
ncbi:MAG TPA: NAD-dependent epimerase/dehydratase family protein [Polyangiaceae bacterium]|nr:NAD-dependent epimerase/dehydratase family protein [Polyangiaceae bacterium]